MIQIKLFSSLQLIRPDSCPDTGEIKGFSIMRNEPFSFQMAYRLKDLPPDEKGRVVEAVPFTPKILSALPVGVYHVGCVPVPHSFSKIHPPMPIGSYPDILYPKKTNPDYKREETASKGGFRYVEDGEDRSLTAYCDSWMTLWLTVNENGLSLEAGTYPIVIELYDHRNQKVGESTLELEIINALLPEQSLVYTNWFHNDCLADFYRLPLFSEEYFSVMKDFIACAVQNGMNMVLLPAFTPPLDTPIGEERMTVQLVDVTFDGTEYTFDFSLMKRYIDVARSAGIRFFEHSHLFTQWGAAHAPKILVSVGGEKQKRFGWETDAAGKEYVFFLRSYLTAVKAFLKGEGLLETTLFHVSDEPNEAHLETYRASIEGIRDLLDDLLVGDALSDYKYYEQGLVKTPIARSHKVMDFVGKCDPLWVYYTGAECYDGLSNRLIQLPRERNRMMGTQLYAFRAKGFLHWGYNFYYGDLCHGLYDPFTDPCCGFPNAGTTYSVYPGRDKKPLQSIHQKIFAEGLVDMRALELLESLVGRKACEKLICEHLGRPDPFNTPRDPETLLAFRAAVNETIKQSL